MNPEIFAKELAKYGFELNKKQKKNNLRRIMIN